METNLLPGTQLEIGNTVIEITDKPHNGCTKFAHQFGNDANNFVNCEKYRNLKLRGLNVCVVSEGVIKAGDTVKKIR